MSFVLLYKHGEGTARRWRKHRRRDVVRVCERACLEEGQVSQTADETVSRVLLSRPLSVPEDTTQVAVDCARL